MIERLFGMSRQRVEKGKGKRKGKKEEKEKVWFGCLYFMAYQTL